MGDGGTSAESPAGLAAGSAGSPGLLAARGMAARRAAHIADLRWRFCESVGQITALPSVHEALVKAMTLGFEAQRRDPSNGVTQRQLDAIVRARTVDLVLGSLPRSPFPYARVLQAAYGEHVLGLFARLVLPYEGTVARYTHAAHAAHAAAVGPYRPRLCGDYLEQVCERVARRMATDADADLILTVRAEALDLAERAVSIYVGRAEALGRRERRVWAK